MKILLSLLMLLPSVVLANSFDNSLSASYFEGEFQNDTNHTYTSFEARKSMYNFSESSSVYGIVTVEDFDHPILDYDNWVGLGFQLDNINLETHTDKDHYRIFVKYTTYIENFILETSFQHSNLFEKGYSQSNLKVGVGYQVKNFSSILSYSVGDLKKRSVNDWYGVTFRYSY